MDDISACRQKIIGSEQMGYYSCPDQFRLAESQTAILDRIAGKIDYLFN